MNQKRITNQILTQELSLNSTLNYLFNISNMKKLFSYLLISSMVVLSSCTNYDDQFDDLNSQINSLKGQIEGFSSLSSGLTALQGTVASLQSAVANIPVTPATDISGLESDLDALSTGLEAVTTKLAELEAALANASTAAEVAALQTALTAAQADITTILENNNVYTGDLSIRNTAELAFATALGDKVAIINGNVVVTVDSDDLDAAAVSAVTSKIASVVGSVTVTTDASLDFSALTAVSSSYSVTGHDIDDAALASANGVTLNYNGAYTQPALVTAGAVTITNKTSTVTGTIAVDFSGLTSGSVNSGTLSLDSAASVKIGSGAAIVSLTAPKALEVELHNAGTLASLTIDTASATSVVVKATKVTGATTVTATSAVSFPSATDVAALTVSAGSFSAPLLTDAAATTVNADEITLTALETLSAAASFDTEALSVPALETAAALTISTLDAVSLPALETAGVITADNAVTFNAGVLVTSAAINTASATTVVLGSATASHIADLATVKELTLNNQATAFAVGTAAELTSLTINGKSASTTSVTVGNAAKLAAISLTGKFASAVVEGALAELESLSTAGTIESLTVSGTTELAAVDFAHTSADVSTLKVVNNAKLGSLTTSTDYLAELTVTGNSVLTAADFSSYANVINDTAATASVTIAIGTNSLTATFTPATAASGATAFAEATIVSASLGSLSAYIQDVYDVDPAMISLSLDPAATTKGTSVAAFSTQNATAVTGSDLPAGAIASEEANALITAN